MKRTSQTARRNGIITGKKYVYGRKSSLTYLRFKGYLRRGQGVIGSDFNIELKNSAFIWSLYKSRENKITTVFNEMQKKKCHILCLFQKINCPFRYTMEPCSTLDLHLAGHELMQSIVISIPDWLDVNKHHQCPESFHHLWTLKTIVQEVITLSWDVSLLRCYSGS